MMESCLLCGKYKCKTCSLSSMYSNNFTPNKQTEIMLSSGMITDDQIKSVHQSTMEARCQISENLGEH